MASRDPCEVRRTVDRCSQGPRAHGSQCFNGLDELERIALQSLLESLKHARDYN